MTKVLSCNSLFLIYYYLMKINFGPDTGGKSMGITSGKPKSFPAPATARKCKNLLVREMSEGQRGFV